MTEIRSPITQQSQAKIIIFGGSGYVGSAIGEFLSKQGYEVVSVSRSGAPKTGWLSGSSAIQYLKADVFSPETWRHLLPGSLGVVNAIGILTENRRKGLFYRRQIYQACRLIADEAVNADIPGLVFLSARPAPFGMLKLYGQYKRLAERYLQRHCHQPLILRPGVVAAPGKPFLQLTATFESACLRLPWWRGATGLLTPVLSLNLAILKYLDSVRETAG